MCNFSSKNLPLQNGLLLELLILDQEIAAENKGKKDLLTLYKVFATTKFQRN